MPKLFGSALWRCGLKRIAAGRIESFCSFAWHEHLKRSVMAESNHLLYRDAAAARRATTLPHNQSDDPLAGLARLIGQGVPMNDLARAARRPTLVGSRSARELTPPARHGYAASDDVLQETSAQKYSTPKQGSYDFDLPNDPYDEGRYEQSPPGDASREYRSPLYEHEPQVQVHVEPSGAWYDEYEEQSHDHSDDHAYSEDYDEDPNPRRRSRFSFVAAVLG